ncbi:MAG: twin-arginine translocase TatA/TatE family subunit [Gemmatimonadota bacterium]|nr:twin-arginine translocase TatA/TatE family subunit [Gemmatimonadota bacterium]
MFGLSPWELLIVFMAILLLFGARRLPEIGSSLGKGIREFKDSIKDVEGEVRREITGGPESTQSAAPQEKEPARPAQPASPGSEG